MSLTEFFVSLGVHKDYGRYRLLWPMLMVDFNSASAAVGIDGYRPFIPFFNVSG